MISLRNLKEPPTPDPEWNKGKSVDNETTQNWLNNLANTKKSPLSFDDLMSTPIDLSAFAMNRLKISKLTKVDLVGPVYNLLKRTCISCVELEYNIEECYRALSDQLDWNNPEGNGCPYDLSKPLPLHESRGRLTDAKYEVEGIEDMLPKLWSLIKVAYDKHGVYSTMRILSVTSVTIDEWYVYGHLKEIVVRKADKKLYKFMEVRNTLDQMLKNLRLGYNKAMIKRKWTATYQKQTRIMINKLITVAGKKDYEELRKVCWWKEGLWHCRVIPNRRAKLQGE
nr:hypothetical protein [Tanacetum cinerariifolium]